MKRLERAGEQAAVSQGGNTAQKETRSCWQRAPLQTQKRYCDGPAPSVAGSTTPKGAQLPGEILGVSVPPLLCFCHRNLHQIRHFIQVYFQCYPLPLCLSAGSCDKNGQFAMTGRSCTSSNKITRRVRVSPGFRCSSAILVSPASCRRRPVGKGACLPNRMSRVRVPPSAPMLA